MEIKKMVFKLIFLYGVWFNPQQIVSLSVNPVGYFSNTVCSINLSRGAYQEGPRSIKTTDTCDVVAKKIMDATK